MKRLLSFLIFSNLAALSVFAQTTDFTGCLGKTGQLSSLAAGSAPLIPCSKNEMQITLKAETSPSSSTSDFSVTLRREAEDVIASFGPFKLIARCTSDGQPANETYGLVDATSSENDWFVTNIPYGMPPFTAGHRETVAGTGGSWDQLPRAETNRFFLADDSHIVDFVVLTQIKAVDSDSSCTFRGRVLPIQAPTGLGAVSK